MQHSAYWAVFKLTVFRAGGHDLCLYFACTGGNAYKERDRWVEQIGLLVANVTHSLYPNSELQASAKTNEKPGKNNEKPSLF